MVHQYCCPELCYLSLSSSPLCVYVCVRTHAQIERHNKSDDVSGVVKHDGGSPSFFYSRAAVASGHGCKHISSHIKGHNVNYKHNTAVSPPKENIVFSSAPT